MLKVIGGIGILYGAGKGLFAWNMRMRQRRRYLQEVSAFLQRMETAVDRECMPLPDFLGTYQSREELLTQTGREMQSLLEEQRAKSVEEAWEKAFSDRQGEWGLTEEAWEIILRCGRAFEKLSRREIVLCLRGMREELEEQMKTEWADYREKKKIFLPVGMLCGVMLVLLCL